MKTILHKSSTRGQADHGWLKSNHSFSFAGYYNPERIRFGTLRVLNDDWIDGGQGFGMHPHDNMEIITIPLSGAVEHKDSMGNQGTISAGEIQVMSAGTGIFHSEYNAHKSSPLELLQIWLFPNERNVTPRYEQISITDLEKQNQLFQIISPNPEDVGLWIHQQAWFHLGNLSEGQEVSYTNKGKNSGVYLFVIEGNAWVDDVELNRRDGIGITETDKILIKASADTKILLMEVPLS